jgi:hypothetical protein
MRSKYKFIQVYNVWVNGRDINDIDQHYPIDNTVERRWHSNFKQAYKDFYSAKNLEGNKTEFGDVYYKDYSVVLYVIDVDIEKFEKDYEMKFDLNNDEVQEAIPYYDNYNFTCVAERIGKF